MIQTLEKLGKRRRDSKLNVFEVGAINIDLQVRVCTLPFCRRLLKLITRTTFHYIEELQVAKSDGDRPEFAAPAYPGVRLLHSGAAARIRRCSLQHGTEPLLAAFLVFSMTAHFR